MRCDSRGNNRGPQQLCRKCSANFSTKALICLNPTLDSAQVGLMRGRSCNNECRKETKGRRAMKGPEDDSGLTDRVAIVSGGGAAGDGIGNGRAAAILLARAGTKVLVADLDLGLAERTVEMILTEGGTAAAMACDVTREADCQRIVEAAVDRWGRLDFLDNNVGIGSRGSVVDEKPEQYRRVMQINVESMFLLSKHAIPAMIKTADGGVTLQSPERDSRDR